MASLLANTRLLYTPFSISQCWQLSSLKIIFTQHVGMVTNDKFILCSHKMEEKLFKTWGGKGGTLQFITYPKIVHRKFNHSRNVTLYIYIYQTLQFFTWGQNILGEYTIIFVSITWLDLKGFITILFMKLTSNNRSACNIF